MIACRTQSRCWFNALAAALAVFCTSVGAATTSPGTIDFGGQSMGTTSPSQAVTFTNTEAVPITIVSITPSAQFAQTNDCPPSLGAGLSCIVNLTFTPLAAAGAINSTLPVAGTLVVTSTALSSPNSVTLAGTAEKSLITHYYRSILRRAPDAGGKAFWEGETVRMQGLGANINEVWYSMAQYFYGSVEYTALARDDNGFATDLYLTFFNRAPDSGGLAFWTGQLASGLPRGVMLAEFMFSVEFTGFAQGIFGNTAARAEVDVVGDFFRGLLARLPDDGGFNHWVGEFRTAQCQGASAVTSMAVTISSQFANGAEYTGRNRTDAQYVGDLYNSFLRRGGELDGVNYWIAQLSTGAATRNQVGRQFIESPEFQGRVTAVVNEGCFSAGTDCSAADTLCVGGPNSEYATIQGAITAMSPGQTVVVFDGTYSGFRIPSNKGGTLAAPTVVRAEGSNVVIDSVNTELEGITISNANYVTVEGFKVQGLPNYGIGCHDASSIAPMKGVTIRNNTVTNSGSVNIYCSNAAESLIEGNSTSGSVASHGIYLSNAGADNTIIRGNISFNNGKNGLHLNGDATQIPAGDGLHNGITIEDNVFYNNTDNAMDLDGLYDSTIRNNLLYGNGHHGIRVFRIDASGGAGNLKIYNNTIIVPIPSGSGSAIKLTEDIGGHTIFNNILINLDDSGTIVTGDSNFQSNNNIVVDSGFSVTEGAVMRNLNQWQAQGYDSASVVSNLNALFVNPSAGDYRLKAGSPAANAGVGTFNGVSAPPKDIAGVARPQSGVVDIGAYESY